MKVVKGKLRLWGSYGPIIYETKQNGQTFKTKFYLQTLGNKQKNFEQYLPRSMSEKY
jgi:hypothetical protein